MKKKLLTVALATVMVVSSAFSAFAKDYELAADSVNSNDNPLKGTNPTEITLEFDMTLTDASAANGWDSVVSIYNTETKGRISFQTNPYVCYNSDGNGGNTSYLDFNQPGGTGSVAKIGDLKDGKAHSFVYKITASGITMSVDGAEVAGVVNGGEATYQEMLDFANTADKLNIGVGKGTDGSFWHTEICTLSNVKVNGTEVGVSAQAETPAPSEGETTTASGETTTAPAATTAAKDNTAANTGDSTMVVALLAVAALSAVVVLKKKTVTE